MGRLAPWAATSRSWILPQHSGLAIDWGCSIASTFAWWTVWIPDATIGEIEQRLPAGLVVTRPEEQYGRTETMIEAFQFNLSALSGIALLGGCLSHLQHRVHLRGRTAAGDWNVAGGRSRTLESGWSFSGRSRADLRRRLPAWTAAGTMAGRESGPAHRPNCGDFLHRQRRPHERRFTPSRPNRDCAGSGNRHSLVVDRGRRFLPWKQQVFVPSRSFGEPNGWLPASIRRIRQLLLAACALLTCRRRPHSAGHRLDGLPIWGFVAGLLIVLGGALLVPLVLWFACQLVRGPRGAAFFPRSALKAPWPPLISQEPSAGCQSRFLPWP